MARGKPLTPAQIQEIARHYAETYSASATAAALGGLAVSTVTRQLAKLGEQKRAKLQRDALGAALAESEDALAETVADIRAYLADGLASHSLEPAHVSGLAQGLARVAVALTSLDAREERRRQSRLTRAKTRAEIERIKKGELVTVDQVCAALAALPQEELAKVVATLRARREASGAAPPEGTK